jgi:hypothetical protein
MMTRKMKGGFSWGQAPLVSVDQELAMCGVGSCLEEGQGDGDDDDAESEPVPSFTEALHASSQ